jgi:hypothetical protein
MDISSVRTCGQPHCFSFGHLHARFAINRLWFPGTLQIASVAALSTAPQDADL